MTFEHRTSNHIVMNSGTFSSVAKAMRSFGFGPSGSYIIRVK